MITNEFRAFEKQTKKVKWNRAKPFQPPAESESEATSSHFYKREKVKVNVSNVLYAGHDSQWRFKSLFWCDGLNCRRLNAHATPCSLGLAASVPCSCFDLWWLFKEPLVALLGNGIPRTTWGFSTWKFYCSHINWGLNSAVDSFLSVRSLCCWHFWFVCLASGIISLGNNKTFTIHYTQLMCKGGANDVIITMRNKAFLKQKYGHLLLYQALLLNPASLWHPEVLVLLGYQQDQASHKSRCHPGQILKTLHFYHWSLFVSAVKQLSSSATLIQLLSAAVLTHLVSFTSRGTFTSCWTIKTLMCESIN